MLHENEIAYLHPLLTANMLADKLYLFVHWLFFQMIFDQENENGEAERSKKSDLEKMNKRVKGWGNK